MIGAAKVNPELLGEISTFVRNDSVRNEPTLVKRLSIKAQGPIPERRLRRVGVQAQGLQFPR
jgi:hypothetical protein